MIVGARLDEKSPIGFKPVEEGEAGG